MFTTEKLHQNKTSLLSILQANNIQLCIVIHMLCNNLVYIAFHYSLSGHRKPDIHFKMCCCEIYPSSAHKIRLGPAHCQTDGHPAERNHLCAQTPEMHKKNKRLSMNADNYGHSNQHIGFNEWKWPKAKVSYGQVVMCKVKYMVNTAVKLCANNKINK